jgi:membrane-bound lytic murein transglycosylase B
VQSSLAELGHYTSTVDGVYGPGTAAAIRAFQAEQGLPESGLPDQRTLLVLFAPTFEGIN